VVRDTIVTRLKGEIELGSTVGQGSVFTLRLPLTLAIIQVLLAGVGGEIFAIPLDSVTRTITVAPGEVHHSADRELITVRGRQVPLVRLATALALDVEPGESELLHVVLIESGSTMFGMVCDRLIGKQEIVIKSLGDVLREVPCAAGATLLGDRVVLILDVPALLARAVGRAGATRGTAAAAEPSPAARPSEPARRRRVLLVEDSDVVRQTLRRLIEGAGFEVVEARDGAEGLALARASQFDLVSTDVMMPHMDGYELTRALRAEPRYAAIPIVMVTSRGEKIDRVRGFDAGVDEYITKPHDRQELLRAIVRHLDPRGTVS
jgi:two-component system chemotaxis sensor kinase CheA